MLAADRGSVYWPRNNRTVGLGRLSIAQAAVLTISKLRNRQHAIKWTSFSELLRVCFCFKEAPFPTCDMLFFHPVSAGRAQQGIPATLCLVLWETVAHDLWALTSPALAFHPRTEFNSLASAHHSLCPSGSNAHTLYCDGLAQPAQVMTGLTDCSCNTIQNCRGISHGEAILPGLWHARLFVARH